MGRSQVLRNQAKGHPGSKGRGGRGQEQAGRRPPPPQGDNAWRYQGEQQANAKESDVNERLLEVESHLPQQGFSSSINSRAESDKDGESFQNLSKELDLSAMAETLSVLTVSERLNIPAYLTTHLETGAVPVRQSSSREKDTSREETEAIRESEDETKSEEEEKSQRGEESDSGDENLDSWLDSVIS